MKLNLNLNLAVEIQVITRFKFIVLELEYTVFDSTFFPLVQCPHWHEITSRAMLDHFEPGNHQRTATISIDVNKNHQSLNHVRAHISESGHCDSVT